MNAKLTLRINENLIKEAKIYASKRGKSVSALVANYFSFLFQVKNEKEKKLPPGVASLKGILKNKKVDEDDYQKYLEKKYL